MRRLLLPALLVVAAGALAGCGDEEVLVDDGTQGVPLAGLGPQVEDAGVEVLDAEAPAGAAPEEVVAALEEAEVAGPDATRPADVAEGFVAFDPTATAGLLSVVGDDAGTAVVLVFADPSSAAVFAAEDPEVFTDAATEGSRAAYLSGNLVAYAASAGDADDAVRTALDALDGGPTATASP